MNMAKFAVAGHFWNTYKLHLYSTIIERPFPTERLEFIQLPGLFTNSGSSTLITPPTKCRLPVINTCTWGFCFLPPFKEGSSGVSSWSAHVAAQCRASEMLSKTLVAAFGTFTESVWYMFCGTDCSLLASFEGVDLQIDDVARWRDCRLCHSRDGYLATSWMVNSKSDWASSSTRFSKAMRLHLHRASCFSLVVLKVVWSEI